MDDYPDPEEEYDLLHEEEMEVLMDMEKEMCKAYPEFKSKKSKNSLNFDNASSDILADRDNEIRLIDNDVSEILNDNVSNKINNKEKKKRCLSSESLIDLNSDLEIVERPSKKLKSHEDLKINNSIPEKEFGITSFKVPSWPFLTIRTYLGDRLYVKLNEKPKSECVPSCIKNKNASKMLVIPYKDLKALIEESFLKKSANDETDDDLMEIEEVLSEADLWVEKFKPKSYFDLLSDEAINRTLLNWLKLWDKIVFNKEVKEKSNKIQSKTNNFQKEVNKLLDADNRPYFKVALLCGPPGLGKTTLAHIAAVMTGYNVVEINASDDRSIEALNTKLDNATQMQAVMGKCKPNCLILDEIDGAPAQTVDFFLKYLNGKYKSKKGKKEKNPDIVKRPVICICNELYTPSLRQLRQQAFVIHFSNISSSKLVQRLLEICRKQDIKTDLTTLSLLCDKAQNDIRSCISTLHFFKNKNNQRFKSTDVVDKYMGQKDIQKSVFNIWKEIFHNPIGKVSLFLKAQKKEIEDEISSFVNYSPKEMKKLQSLIQNCQASGDYDRLSEGVFENFLKSKFSGGMESVYNGLEWFCWFDLLDTNIKKTQNYFLMSYLPYSFGMWQILYSSNSFWKITYPTSGYENHTKEVKHKQILKDVAKGLRPNLRTYYQQNSLLFDVLPLVDIIVKPPLRPVNPTLFNEEEKKDFKHLIDVMCDFNLTYVQERSADGTYNYHLDPNADELIKFNVNNQTNRRTYSYGLQQIISHELDLEKMRRSEEPNYEDRPGTVDEKKTKASFVEQLKSTEVNNHEKESYYKDFFGRIVQVEKSYKMSGVDEKNADLKSPVWFCYKQGYNNAVKKDIYLADIM